MTEEEMGLKGIEVPVEFSPPSAGSLPVAHTMQTRFTAFLKGPLSMRSAMGLCLLSGFLLTAGFPRLELFYLSWIALVPLLAAVQGRSGKEAFRLGALCGLAHFATALYWIDFVVSHYGGIPLPLAVLVLLLLCSYLAIYPAVFALVAQRWEGNTLLWVFGLPCVWVALEWVRAHALTGFPWANLGYTQTPFTPLIQIADITGVFGVSWLIVFGNTALLAAFNRYRFRAGLAVCGLLLAGCVFYGSWRLDAIERLEKAAPAWTAAVVQGNIDQSHKWDPAFQQETLERYRSLSLAAANHDPAPDLIVWPETSAPFFYGIEEANTAELNGMIRQIGKPLLFGSPAVTLLDGKPRLQNRAYLVDGGATLEGAYAKQHLVPFGEYVPFQKVLFFVHRLVEAAGDFVPGHDATPLKLGDQRLGVLICYEGIFPDLARATVAQGATALINITNDAWYGRTSAPYQHLEIARWRAIEFRVPLIRAANTGISSIFDAAGKSCGSIALDDPGYLVGTVHPFHVMTLYARWGDLFAWICALTTVGGLLYSTRARRSV